MERRLHTALARWADDHSRRYPGIEVLAYEPDRYPGQRIDTSVTRTRFELEGDQPAGLDTRLRNEFEKTLGVRALHVSDAVAPWVDKLKRLLAHRGRAIVLTAHADLIHDIGVISGGLAIALEDVELIRRNGTILNKVMSREAFAGLPIPELFGSFANVYWVIPETENAVRWGVSEELSSYVNANAMRTLLGDMRGGILLTIAPSGTAMRAVTDASGRIVRLNIPPVSRSTANLIGRFDAYAIGVLFAGQIAVGPLTPLQSMKASSRGEKRIEQQRRVVGIMEEMAMVVSSAAGVPVSYEASVDAP
jgi:hypothetical protein